ncbi:MAG: hypothetical protein SP4CHLAM5_03170 [Chlamydiia bacterium]|nr:hypothetical protein [Chlamydiia bacterium]MCH9618191.1 hypothetical protein [Chlamydiia bacterium]MCH9624086.1 hypothetical protein [Chlamydiia bacterium]
MVAIQRNRQTRSDFSNQTRLSYPPEAKKMISFYHQKMRESHRKLKGISTFFTRSIEPIYYPITKEGKKPNLQDINEKYNHLVVLFLQYKQFRQEIATAEIIILAVQKSVPERAIQAIATKQLRQLCGIKKSADKALDQAFRELKRTSNAITYLNKRVNPDLPKTGFYINDDIKSGMPRLLPKPFVQGSP